MYNHNDFINLRDINPVFRKNIPADYKKTDMESEQPDEFQLAVLATLALFYGHTEKS